MITSDEKIKILVFGLAKALAAESAVAAATQLPTINRGRAGTILGTAAYMSSEQAKGKATCRRVRQPMLPHRVCYLSGNQPSFATILLVMTPLGISPLTTPTATLTRTQTNRNAGTGALSLLRVCPVVSGFATETATYANETARAA